MAAGYSASISKSCIAIKGSGKQRLEKGCVPVNKQLTFYKKLSALIDQKTEDIHSRECKGVLEDLTKFICTPETKSSVRRIPAALLILGANIPDHGATFSFLVKELKCCVSTSVVFLRAEDCGSVKLMIQNMVSRTARELDGQVEIKKVNCTMTVMQEYYEKHLSGSKSPKKKPRTENTGNLKPKVIVVIDELEAVEPKVVENFIEICSEYSSSIPFVFVFGIPTCMSPVQRLPQSVLKRLRVEKFCFPPPAEYLNVAVAEFLMCQDLPFKIGPRVYRLVEYNFLCHDFSVKNFAKTLKYCLMEHFDEDLPSILCCHREEADEVSKKLSSADLRNIRKLSSFRTYVESQPLKTREALIRNDNALLAAIPQFLRELHEYHTDFLPALHCLNRLSSQLPKHPLGKKLRELYGHCLNAAVFATPEYKKALELIRMLSTDELVARAEDALNVEQLTSETLSPKLREKRQEILRLLENLKINVGTVGEESKRKADVGVEVKKTRSEFQQMVKGLGSVKVKDGDPTASLKDEVIVAFELMFRTYLKCPKAMTLHEAFYYDNSAKVKGHLNGNPREVIQAALSDPARYLECQCCELKDTGSVSKDMPDTAIVYKLYLERERLINMHDWLESFIAIKSDCDDLEQRKQLQIRFSQAVSELQFLGFVQPTLRKTDHVTRLTW